MTVKTKPEIKVACDEPGCHTTPPTREQLLQGGGLVGLGWFCAGANTHFCPDHHPKDRK